MPSRRQIREAVIQFLYAEGPVGIPAEVTDAPSLALLLEPLEQKVTIARAKAMVHLQQGRAKVATGLQALAPELDRLATTRDRDLLPLFDLLTAEQDVARHLESLQHELHGNKNPATLVDILDDCSRSEAAGKAAVTRLLDVSPDLPAPAELRTDALTIADALRPYRDRTLLVFAEDPGPQPELKALQKACQNLAAARRDIAAKLAGLAAQLPTLDALIADTVENYSPERLDRVDRAILRLATYEMLHDDEVPPPVAIDEAIELARAFGTTDSPGFVNGVLDRIHKATSSQSPSNL